MENTSFTYDANGNMTAGGGRTVTWTSFDMVRTITAGVLSTSFDYDSEHNRIRQVTATETTHYFWAGALGAPAEKVVAFGGQAAWKEYILAGGQTVAQQVTFLDGQGAVTSTHRRYFVNDHLGSIAVVLDEAGAVLERLSYDAWGKRRNADWTDDPAGALTSEVSRGYTGHEMLDGFGLVHMNGRLYDPVIGRFLSPDPHVQERLNGQNLNRYAYVLNNPLSMTDPSGYFFSKAVKSIGRAIGRAVKSFAKFVASRQGLSLAVGAALMHALPVAAPGISPYLAAGISGGVSGAVASGTPEGALMGMVTATSFAGIGHALPMNGLSPAGQTVAKAGLKGLVSGGLSAASGGKFQAGFLSASFSALAAPHVEGVVGEGYAANLIGQGLVGGLASEFGGGKFASGFHTGAFNYMFNDAVPCEFTNSCWNIGEGGGGGIAIGGAVAATVVTSETIDRALGQLEALIGKMTLAGPQAVQYALVAEVSGIYPDVRRGITFLNPGDVWKYGITTDPLGRYTQSFFKAFNLQVVREYPGSISQVLVMEKIKLVTYARTHGTLPPGNYRFK